MNRFTGDVAPCKTGMVRHPHWLNVFCQTRQLIKIPAVNAHSRAQTQTYAVQTDGVMDARLF